MGTTDCGFARGCVSIVRVKITTEDFFCYEIQKQAETFDFFYLCLLFINFVRAVISETITPVAIRFAGVVSSSYDAIMF